MVFLKKKRKIPVRASDIMVREIVYVRPEDPVSVAAKKMVEERIGSVLVLDSEGRLRGIVTERDLVYVVSESWDPNKHKVWEVMTEDPIIVKPDDDLVTVIKKMSDIGVRHLPVVDESGKPIGIISYRDVLDFMMSVFAIALGLREEL
ncbi:MAG: CBS domain-containing protein [Aeropyrum sp.]|nr:CBS domain-containing protein [Aeropyrum sp.]